LLSFFFFVLQQLLRSRAPYPFGQLPLGSDSPHRGGNNKHFHTESKISMYEGLL
jgi:hypothetical protein